MHISEGVGVLTRRKRGSPGLTPWEGHEGRGCVGGTPELRIVEGADDNLAPPPFTWGAEEGRPRPPPDLLRFLGKEGFPPPASPLSATPAASPARLPVPEPWRRSASGLSSARAAQGSSALQRSRAPAGIWAGSASRPRLPPLGVASGRSGAWVAV